MTGQEMHEYLVNSIGENYLQYPKCVKWYLLLLKNRGIVWKEQHIDIHV